MSAKPSFVASVVSPDIGPAVIPSDSIGTHCLKPLKTAASVVAPASGTGLIVFFPGSARGVVACHYVLAGNEYVLSDTINMQDLTSSYDYGAVCSARFHVFTTGQVAAFVPPGTMVAACRYAGPSEEGLPTYAELSNLTTNTLDTVGAVSSTEGIELLYLPSIGQHQIRLGDNAPFFVGQTLPYLTLTSKIQSARDALTYTMSGRSSVQVPLQTHVLDVPSWSPNSVRTSGPYATGKPMLLGSALCDGIAGGTVSGSIRIYLPGGNLDTEPLVIAAAIYGLDGELMDFGPLGWIPLGVDINSTTCYGPDDMMHVALSGSFPCAQQPAQPGIPGWIATGAETLVNGCYPQPIGHIEFVAYLEQGSTSTGVFSIDSFDVSFTSINASEDAAEVNPIYYVIYAGQPVGNQIAIEGVTNYALLPNPVLQRDISVTRYMGEDGEDELYNHILNHRDQIGLRTVWAHNKYVEAVPRLLTLAKPLGDLVDMSTPAHMQASAAGFGSFLSGLIKKVGTVGKSVFNAGKKALGQVAGNVVKEITPELPDLMSFAASYGGNNVMPHIQDAAMSASAGLARSAAHVIGGFKKAQFKAEAQQRELEGLLRSLNEKRPKGEKKKKEPDAKARTKRVGHAMTRTRRLGATSTYPTARALYSEHLARLRARLTGSWHGAMVAPSEALGITPSTVVLAATIPYHLPSMDVGDDIHLVPPEQLLPCPSAGILFPVVYSDVGTHDIASSAYIAIPGDHRHLLSRDASHISAVTADGHRVYGAGFELGEEQTFFPATGMDLTVLPVQVSDSVPYIMEGGPIVGHSCDLALVLASVTAGQLITTPTVLFTGTVDSMGTVGEVLGTEQKSRLAGPFCPIVGAISGYAYSVPLHTVDEAISFLLSRVATDNRLDTQQSDIVASISAASRLPLHQFYEVLRRSIRRVADYMSLTNCCSQDDFIDTILSIPMGRAASAFPQPVQFTRV